jgi:glycosyltransferase involved in cell wall biosynthesis
MVEKKKILEICPFSSGVCGVWARVLNESREFIKNGFEVRVFSSNQVKGDESKIACSEDNLGEVAIKRFKSNAGIIDKLISKNVTYFNFKKEFEEYSPDIVITHLLHPHSFKALKLCKIKKIPCFLVTHAPFNVDRKFPLNLVTDFFYGLNVKPYINDFTKVISITKWELPYLEKLGVKKEKIAYVPNGLSKEFFTKSKIIKAKGILFLGRIAPVKHLETIIMAAKYLPSLNFTIVGSAEKEYLSLLERIIKKNNIKNIKILPAIYDLKKKIELIDRHLIFVLPSRREAMPQSILEALARGKIVLASETDGAGEILNGKNGLLFPVGDHEKLISLINNNLKGNINLEKNARLTAKNYAWDKLIKDYLRLFNVKK